MGKVYDAEGRLVYDGPLADGMYEGPGARVYQNGTLVYEGEMARNLYEGQGRRTNPATGVVSEGAFSHGLLEGQGQEFSRSGTLLRSGVFSRDLLNGPGVEYRPDGALLREGTFAEGLLNGEGAEYGPDGNPEYEGTFRRGVRQGTGSLYDTALNALVYQGDFEDGSPRGAGRIYHPSGQLLYEGPVFDGRPRADAFLGLSLAEVEAAFSEHWLLYAGGETAAFVYPYFRLLFATAAPVPLAPLQSPAREDSLPAEEAPEADEPLSPEESAAPEEPPVSEGPVPSEKSPIPEEPLPTEEAASPEEVPLSEDPAPSGEVPFPEDRGLSPEAVKTEILITEVLSWGQPLAGAAQPKENAPSGREPAGWRERFSDFAASGGPAALKTGPFLYEFPEIETGAETEFYLAARGGVETRTVRREDKDGSLWYQSAVREAEP